MTRAIVGACGLAVATGWNVANTGAIAQALVAKYGVGLADAAVWLLAVLVVPSERELGVPAVTAATGSR